MQLTNVSEGGCIKAARKTARKGARKTTGETARKTACNTASKPLLKRYVTLKSFIFIDDIHANRSSEPIPDAEIIDFPR